MPYHEPDRSDPDMLVGVGTACSARDLAEMAAAFASELAQLGRDGAEILDLFREPSHAGAHLAWCALGEEQVRRIVAEAVEFWGRVRVRVTDLPARKTALLWPGRD